MKPQCYCICIRGSLFYAVSLVHVSAEEERKSDAICALLLWGEPGHHCLPAPFGYGSSAFAAKRYNRCLIQINFRRCPFLCFRQYIVPGVVGADCISLLCQHPVSLYLHNPACNDEGIIHRHPPLPAFVMI